MQNFFHEDESTLQHFCGLCWELKCSSFDATVVNSFCYRCCKCMPKYNLCTLVMLQRVQEPSHVRLLQHVEVIKWCSFYDLSFFTYLLNVWRQAAPLFCSVAACHCRTKGLEATKRSWWPWAHFLTIFAHLWYDGAPRRVDMPHKGNAFHWDCNLGLLVCD